MRDDMLFMVPVVDCRLEYLNGQFAVLRPSDTTNQLFRFPGKHTATNYFNPAVLIYYMHHRPTPSSKNSHFNEYSPKQYREKGLTSENQNSFFLYLEFLSFHSNRPLFPVH